MRLPGIFGTAQDFQTPTRRNFLQGVGAVLLPKPPIDVGRILEGPEASGKGIHPIFSKIGKGDMLYGFGGVGDLVRGVEKAGIIDSFNELLQRYKGENFPKMPGNTDEAIKKWVLEVYDYERPRLEQKHSEYFHNLPQDFLEKIEPGSSWIVFEDDGLVEILDALKEGREPNKSDFYFLWPEYSFSFNFKDGCLINLDVRFTDSGVHIGGSIYGEFPGIHIGNFDFLDSHEGLKELLESPVHEFRKVLLGESNHLEIKQRLKDYMQERETKQLPLAITEFSELMNEILSGKIEVTNEVRHQVGVLLAS